MSTAATVTPTPLSQPVDLDHAQSVAIDAAKLAGKHIVETFYAAKEVNTKDG